MTKDYELTLVDYLSIMRSRAPYLIGTFVLVLLASAIAAFTIPPTYRASGTVLVESAQGADVVAPRTGRNNIDERINVIKQLVMTREGLMPIINKYRLFGENAGSLPPTDLVDRMRNRVAVESISSGGSNRYNEQTIAFTISFEDRRPEVALQVANDLVALFLEWNVKLRTEGATEAATFLAQESDRLKAEVDRLEEQISAFKKRHSNTLPEQLALRATVIARAENDLYLIERDIRSGNEELRSLETELSSSHDGASGDPSQTLPALKAEYARLSGIYTDSHPDIQALRRKIDALSPGGSTSAQNTLVNATHPGASRIQAKIDSVNARLDSLRQQKKMLQGKIAQNENAMEQTPGVAQNLDVLIRDRDSAQRKFDEIRNKKINAEIAQNMENENKSDRFSLVEPPVLPEKPIKPNRVKIIVLGFFLALGSSGGLLMALPIFDRRVRGVDALSYVLGHRPLAVVPYLIIQEEEARRKRVLRLAAIAAISASLMTILLSLSSRLSGDLLAKMLAGIS